MKKVIAVLIALVMVLSLMACNGTTSDPVTSNPGTTSSANGTSSEQAEATQQGTQQATQPEATQQASTAAGDSTTAPAANLEPVRIGHIADLTGVESSVGLLAKEAMDYALKEMGGQINGRPVEIIIVDSQSSPSVAVDMAKKMVERDKVVAILGPTQIGHKSAVSEYIKSAGIPLILYNPTPVGLIKSNPWLVGAGGTTIQMPSAMGDYAYNELGYRKVHTIAMDNTGGRAFVDPFVATFKSL
ncbi:MAG: ABC transporter substrate-binding protein, partial [Clostridiales bacterium]|nr:ABC transporter substrate-binding protein [Clostridiales bacterium]